VEERPFRAALEAHRIGALAPEGIRIEGQVANKYRVVQVKGTKPETFIVVGIDFAASAITSTSESMHEPEMRTYLQKQGASNKDIDTWIDQARHYPG
jgi:hypothetical protein